MTQLLEQSNKLPDQSNLPHEQTNDPTAQLISIKEVCQLTSLSRSYVNRLRATGYFPPPVILGERRIAFVKSEVEAWIAARIAERDGRAA